jgi:hypothetical protein
MARVALSQCREAYAAAGHSPPPAPPPLSLPLCVMCLCVCVCVCARARAYIHTYIQRLWLCEWLLAYAALQALLTLLLY